MIYEPDLSYRLSDGVLSRRTQFDNACVRKRHDQTLIIIIAVFTPIIYAIGQKSVSLIICT